MILGSLNWSLLELIEDDEDRKYFTDVFHSVDETLLEMKRVFLDFGIKVVRPEPLVVDKDRPLVTPFFCV